MVIMFHPLTSRSALLLAALPIVAGRRALAFFAFASDERMYRRALSPPMCCSVSTWSLQHTLR